MTFRQDSHLRFIHFRNRTRTEIVRAPGLANVQISDQSVRRRLRESRRSVVGPILKQRHITAIHGLVHGVVGGFIPWQHILFSDGSRFSLRFSDGRYRVHCKRGEHCTDPCVYESARFGGGSVMVWLELVMMVALSSNCPRYIECR